MGRCPVGVVDICAVFVVLMLLSFRITVSGYGFCRCGKGRCCMVTWTDDRTLGPERLTMIGADSGSCRRRRESFAQAPDRK